MDHKYVQGSSWNVCKRCGQEKEQHEGEKVVKHVSVKTKSEPVKKAVIPPVQVGQTVFLSVLPKPDIIGNYSDCSPKVFATRDAAQKDCDDLNKGRMGSGFVVREVTIN